MAFNSLHARVTQSSRAQFARKTFPFVVFDSEEVNKSSQKLTVFLKLLQLQLEHVFLPQRKLESDSIRLDGKKKKLWLNMCCIYFY